MLQNKRTGNYRPLLHKQVNFEEVFALHTGATLHFVPQHRWKAPSRANKLCVFLSYRGTSTMMAEFSNFLPFQNEFSCPPKHCSLLWNRFRPLFIQFFTWRIGRLNWVENVLTLSDWPLKSFFFFWWFAKKDDFSIKALVKSPSTAQAIILMVVFCFFFLSALSSFFLFPPTFSIQDIKPFEQFGGMKVNNSCQYGSEHFVCE